MSRQYFATMLQDTHHFIDQNKVQMIADLLDSCRAKFCLKPKAEECVKTKSGMDDQKTNVTGVFFYLVQHSDRALSCWFRNVFSTSGLCPIAALFSFIFF